MAQARHDNVVEPFPAPKSARSIGSLFSDLARETSLLLRQEVALAKAEVVGQVSRLGSGAGLLVAGGLIAYAGLLALIAAAIIGIAQALPWWLAALIMGAFVVVVGGVLALVGRSRMRAANLVPRRTLRTLRDDTEWAKEQVR